MNTIELTNQEMILVEGGISPKSILIGAVLSSACPILGVGYWIGYYVNS